MSAGKGTRLLRMQKQSIIQSHHWEQCTLLNSAPIFQSLEIVKLEDTLHLNILTFLYNSINRLSPSCFCNYCELNLTIHKLELVRQPEVIFLKPLRIMYTLYGLQTVSILAPNFGTLFHYSYLLLTLLQFLVQIENSFP